MCARTCSAGSHQARQRPQQLPISLNPFPALLDLLASSCFCHHGNQGQHLMNSGIMDENYTLAKQSGSLTERQKLAFREPCAQTAKAVRSKPVCPQQRG